MHDLSLRYDQSLEFCFIVDLECEELPSGLFFVDHLDRVMLFVENSVVIAHLNDIAFRNF